MPHELNYSLGVLIVLLMMFWFVCKCIGGNKEYRQGKECCQQRETMVGENISLYGDNKITIGNGSAYPYMRIKKGVIEVPNSKSAMRRLMSTEIYKCGLTAEVDNEPSSMYMKKKSTEKFSQHPKGLTQERGLHPFSYKDMKPMPSY